MILNQIERLLEEVGMPPKQRNKVCCLTLLALLGLKKSMPLCDATNGWIRIHDILAFINKEYQAGYKENTRETIRKDALHHFRRAALVEDNGKATNSPLYRYRVTEEFLSVVKHLDTEPLFLNDFLKNHESLISQYTSKKKVMRMPVKINEKAFTFSPGRHNELQKAILEDFAPRFAPGSECLYVGDSDARGLHRDDEKLARLGFEITLHDKMPDVVLYREDKNWLYFIESVTTVGPMNPKRIREISDMTRNVRAGKIFVTAFLDKGTFKKFFNELAWDTEVWIAGCPNHLIHLNGDKYLEPHPVNQG